MKTIGITLLIGAYGYWGYFTLNSINGDKLEERRYVKCGTVKSKVNETRGDGDYTNTTLYLGIQYDDGTFDAEEMGPKTFLQKEKGDRICLNFYKDMDKSQVLNNTLFFGSLFSLFMFGMSRLDNGD